MKNVISVEIPVLSERVARWEIKVDLSGKRYGLYVSWNTRQEAWFMTISDSNNKLLLAGIRLVPGVSFLEKYRASVSELPPGILELLDVEMKPGSAEVTRNNLHTRFALTYTVFEG